MSTPPCLSCGVCCFSQLETYVRVSGADHTRLGDDAERVTRFQGNRCYMRMIDGHCIALAFDPSGHYVCTIYEQRPEACRSLARDSSECAAERALKSERPLQARVRKRANSQSRDLP